MSNWHSAYTGTWDHRLAEVNAQLEAKNIIMTEGRINSIDATPVEAAQSGPGNGVDGTPKRDSDAGWPVKNNSRGVKKSIYGFSVHTGVDEEHVQATVWFSHTIVF